MQAQYGFSPHQGDWPNLSCQVCALSCACPCWGPSVVLSRTVWGRFSLNRELIISATLAGQWAPPVSIPQHWDTDVHLLGFCSKHSEYWINSSVSLPNSWRTLSTSYPQRFLLYSVSGPQQCFFCTVKHSSQPADPWEFPRLLTYKGQNYFCNNTKTLFILVHWHLHWLSKWTDG